MCANYVAVENHDDFPQVYNLDDPRSYFRALQPLGYRAPAVMAEFIEASRVRTRRFGVDSFG